MRPWFAATLFVVSAVACRGEERPLRPDDVPSKAPKKVEPPKSPVRLPKQHRASAEACPRLDVAAATAPFGKMAPGPACATAKDCPTWSRCVRGRCHTDDCYEDTDCGPSAVCACEPAKPVGANFGRGHRCVKSACRLDADCGPGGACSPTFDFDCGSYHGVVGYQCHTAKDACTDDVECQEDGGTPYAYCGFEPKSGRWTCGQANCKG